MVLNEFVNSCEFETPAELQSLMSDSNMISDFMLTIPWIFNRWLEVPNVDMFRELQLMEDTEMFGKLVLRLVIERVYTIRLKTTSRVILDGSRFTNRLIRIPWGNRAGETGYFLND